MFTLELTLSIFFIFAFIIFFVLIRESIIDIKTMYVPDNIIYAIYGTSIFYVLIQFLLSKKHLVLINGIIGFLVGIGIPFLISYSAYLVKKIEYKNIPHNPETKEIVNCKTKENYKIHKIKEIIYYVLILCIIIFFGLKQKMINSFVFISIFTTFVILIILAYKKYKKIEIVFYGLSIIGISIIALYWNTQVNGLWKNVLLYSSIGFFIEIILSRLLKKFYNVEELLKKEQEYKESIDEEIIYGGIGGGDILIFGALGIMFGYKALIVILIYSCIAQIGIILSYYFLSNIDDYLPFVPGIAFGTLMYISTYDFFNIKKLIDFILR